MVNMLNCFSLSCLQVRLLVQQSVTPTKTQSAESKICLKLAAFSFLVARLLFSDSSACKFLVSWPTSYGDWRSNPSTTAQPGVRLCEKAALSSNLSNCFPKRVGQAD